MPAVRARRAEMAPKLQAFELRSLVVKLSPELAADDFRAFRRAFQMCRAPCVSRGLRPHLTTAVEC